MINFARQAFANPFVNPFSAATGLGQQMGGFVPTPYGVVPATGFGLINPLAAHFAGGFPQTTNPLVAQLAASLPVSQPLHQGIGSRIGTSGIDPRLAFATGGQQWFQDPNDVAPAITNPTFMGDPITSLLAQQGNPFSQQVNPLLQQGNPFSQQVNPLLQQGNPFSQQVNPLSQQQLPIRSLIGQQGAGTQQPFPGFGSALTPRVDPYRAFVEAQLISQLATNPFYQLQRAYGITPEVTGVGIPFGMGQQSNQQWGNVPFYG